MANLQATCSTRAFRTVPPQELTDAAHKAARLIDTDAHIQTASRSYTRALWYQSRKRHIKVEMEVDKGAPGPSTAPPAPVPVP